MSTEEKAVETKVEVAAPQQEVDYEAELAEVNAKLKKSEEDKENYRKGMLKAKGKLPEEDNLEEDLDERIARKVRETILTTQDAELLAKKDKLSADMAKKLKEMSVALKNRAQVTDTSATGSNKDKPEVKVDSFFSKEQLADFKSKGWSDAKIESLKQNMLKAPK